AQRTLGYGADEPATPGSFQTILQPSASTAFQEARARSLAGETTRVELRFQDRRGDTRIGYALLQPLVHDNAVLGSTCLIVDTTLQCRLEEDLQRAQRLELVGRLASGTVHDFNS